MRLYLDMHPGEPTALPGAGELPCDLAIVGIAPSKSRPYECRNEPFGSKSWSTLQSILTKFPGLRIYVTNLVKVPVDHGDQPTREQIADYYPLLIKELKFAAPKRILAMGVPVAQVLCPGFKVMREDHGTLFMNPELGCTVVPTFHFSAIARDATKKPILARDLERFFTMKDPDKPFYEIIPGAPLSFPPNSQVIIDIETTGLEARVDEITMVGVKVRGDYGCQIIPTPSPSMMIDLLRTAQASHSTLIGHNFQFDLHFMAEKSGTHWDVPIEDTMLMAYIAGEEVLSLKNLTTVYTERPGSRAFGDTTSFSYLAEDLLSTEAIYATLDPRTKDVYARRILHRLVPDVVGMRRRGIFIDRPLLKELQDKKTGEVQVSSGKLAGLVGKELNWNSNPQMVTLFQEHEIPLTEKTDKGAFTLKESALLPLAKKYPLAQAILDHRAIVKELEFYTSYDEKTTDDHPYLHPRLGLSGARTGRTSCSNPNLQQVPREGPVKLLFKSRWDDGLIGLVDLSQAELRVAAMLSNDEVFAAALMEGDVHLKNAAIAYKIPEAQVTPAQRKRVKGVTFGVLYGGSPSGLAQRVGVGVNEVKIILKAIFSTYRKLANWITMIQESSILTRQVFNHFGRRRDLTGVLVLEGEGGAKRKGVNTPIQGLASDIDLIILYEIGHRLRLGGHKSRPLISVHDSVLMEVFAGESEICYTLVQEAFESLGNTPLADLPLFSSLPYEGEFIVGKTWAHVESTNEAYDPIWKVGVSSLPEISLSGGRY